MTNEKLSALNTNSKSARPKTKENEIVKHGNAEKSKKRKEKRVSNRTWDTVVMVTNEKGILGITRKLCEISDRSRHGVFAKCNAEGKLQRLAEIKESWPICKLCRETCGKALDRMREKIKSFKSYAEYTNWYFNYMIAGTIL